MNQTVRLTTNRTHDAGRKPIDKDIPLSVNIDEGETYTYVGRAEPGAADGDAKWSIRRIENASGSSRVADKGSFTQVWNDRTTLNYA